MAGRGNDNGDFDIGRVGSRARGFFGKLGRGFGFGLVVLLLLLIFGSGWYVVGPGFLASIEARSVSRALTSAGAITSKNDAGVRSGGDTSGSAVSSVHEYDTPGASAGASMGYATLAPLEHAAVVDWLASPISATLTVFLVLTLAWHSKLGVQVVIEDYVHHHGAKLVMTLLSVFLHILAAGVGVFAVLKVAFGGTA